MEVKKDAPIVTVKKDDKVYCTYTAGTFSKEYLDSMYGAGYAVYLNNKKLTLKQARSQL